MMWRERTVVHPNPELLLALVDHESTASDNVREHVAACATCAKRVENLRKMRGLLRDAADRNQRSPSGLTDRALLRLRLRHTTIENVNDLFASIYALLVGFTELLSRKPRPPVATPVSTPAKDKDLPRG